jgi:predicted ATP-grasp superfamily ATP-dependent carboligase
MWPLAFGNSSLCISIPASEVNSLKEILFRYLRDINYHGIFSAELKKSHRDDVFKLLEINSRTSAWFNTLSAKCGINIMLTAYLDAIGRDIKYLEDYEAGVKWLFLRDDLRSAIRMVLNGDLGIHEWVSSLLGKKDHISYAKDDLRPFIMNLMYTIAKII